MRDSGAVTWADVLAVLRARPGARLNAVNDLALFVPLPAGMQGTGHEQLPGQSGMDAIEPADHGLVIDAWMGVLAVGHASTEVRDRTHPLHLTRLEFFDLRPVFGVFAAVAYPTVLRGVQSAGPVPADGDDRPRIGRLSKDERGLITEADAAAEQMLGARPGGLLGIAARELVHPEDQERSLVAWTAMLGSPGSRQRVRLRQLRGDGSWLWVDVINCNLLHDPAYGCVVSDLVDVSQEMELRDDARARERLLHRLTQALPVGVVQLSPAGEVVYSNERLHRILGVAGGSYRELLAPLRPADRERLVAVVGAALRAGLDDDLQVELAPPSVARVLDVAVRPLVDGAVVEGVLVCVTDITDDVRLRAELEQRATHDVLTGCLNRGAVLRRLEEELTRVLPGHGCAVLFLDLDGFKAVNDSRGHAAGDELLREVAAVLRSAARTGDAVGRLGGDEFVLVCPRIDSAELALALAVDVQARLRRSQPAERPTWGASTGVTWVDDASLAAETVLGRADEAMYAAKQERRQVVVLWPPPAAGRATGNQNVIARQPLGHALEARSSAAPPPAGRP